MDDTETAVAPAIRLAPLQFRRVESAWDLNLLIMDRGPGQPGLFFAIAADQQSKLRGMTPDFVPMLYFKAMSDPNNRLIGEFGGVWVWVKPWVPAGHVAYCTEEEALAAHGVYRADTLTVA